MPRLSEVLRRLRHFGGRTRFDAELRDEMEFHVESRADELVASGMPRIDALAQARREFGSAVRAGEDTRSAWRFQWLEEALADFRYALRSCRKHPAFTVTVCVSLAIGIGANSAVLTAVDAVMWKRIGAADAGSLARMSVVDSRGTNREYMTYELARHIERTGAFAHVAFQTGDGLSFSYDGRAERISGEAVSPNFFTVLGLTPALGQGFSPEVRAGAWAAEAVLSYRFWRTRFHGDRSVIGRTIHLNSYPFVVVGVSPPSYFDFVQGHDPELRIPLLPEGRTLAQIEMMSGASDNAIMVIGRLKPGATLSQAEQQINARFAEFLATTTNVTPGRQGWSRVSVESGARGWTNTFEEFHTALYVLLALAVIVLVIACANVAGMLLARATERRRELAVRVSIGAGRRRLVRQLLAESVVLAILGGALAVPLAAITADLLPGFLPQGHISFALDIRPDARMLLFTGAIALIAGLVVGVVPAIHATHGDLTGALKSDTASSVGESRGSSMRRALVIAQVAFSLIMLVVSALFVRGVSDLTPLDFNAPADRVLLFTIKPQRELYDAERMHGLARELTRRMSALPGVRAAALAETGALASRRSRITVRIPGDSLQVIADDVTPGFFDAAGISLRTGRDFRDSDSPASPRVAIINESLARRLFGDANPVGRTINAPGPGGFESHEVIAVAADVRYHDLRTAPAPTIWRTYQVWPPYMPTLHVRAADANTAATLANVRREFDAIDTGFPIFNVMTLEARIASALARERMVAVLSAAFGALALVLAAVGLHGVLAYSVAKRTREIGLRMALGSSARAVLWLVGRDALRLVAIGSVVGLVLAIVSGRVMARLFAGVPAADARAFAASALLLLGVATVAVVVPALRASRVNPLTALRTD